MAGPKRGHFSRSRSLADLDSKFEEKIVEKTLEQRCLVSEEVRLLEIGCGEGRVLMELRKLFPNLDIHGINKKPWPAMRGSNSLMATGLFYNIFKRSEINHVKLPFIHFYNATKLKFPDNYFDVVISQVAIQYFDRKDWIIEEVWRVLKTGGKAFLHIDTAQEDMPDFLDYDTPRFVIYLKGRIYEVRKLVEGLQDRGYNIKYSVANEENKTGKKRRITLVFDKNNTRRLNLNLKLDRLSSFDLSVLNPKCNKDSPYWGYRSVYRI